MSNENDRFAGDGPELLELRLHTLLGLNVERTEGLFHQKDIRIIGYEADNTPLEYYCAYDNSGIARIHLSVVD